MQQCDPSMGELFNLAGKVAVVTGGAGWLGSVMAQGLAEAQATVALVDNNAASLDRLLTKLAEKELTAVGFAADVMAEASLAEVMDRIARECGRIDILVNCANLPCVQKDCDDLSLAEIEDGYRNASAAVVAAKYAAPHMRTVGAGSIINIASKAGVVTSDPQMSAGALPYLPLTYEAQKAAVIHMTRHMAVHYAPDGIRVNCISPGAFPHDSVSPTLIQRFSDRAPLKRVGQRWELKGVAVFLASQASSFVTGQNILVDGGWTIW